MKSLRHQKKFITFSYLKHTLKPDSTISNQENKVPTGKPKMSNAKALMTNSAPIENNERSINIQPKLKALRQQLTAQHSAKQIFKRGRLPQLEQNSRYH